MLGLSPETLVAEPGSGCHGNQDAALSRSGCGRADMGDHDMFRTTGALALGAVLLATAASASDTSTLEAAQQSWEKAFAAGDGMAAAEAVYTEDARLLPPGEPVVEGREAIGKYWQGAMDAGFHGLDLGLIDVEIVGDTMIETGTWTVTFPAEGGGEATATGKALVIWKQGADGVWRMSQDMWNAGP